MSKNISTRFIRRVCLPHRQSLQSQRCGAPVRRPGPPLNAVVLDVPLDRSRDGVPPKKFQPAIERAACVLKTHREPAVISPRASLRVDRPASKRYNY